jgi:thiol:disulfide interchange protein DsbD
VALAALLLCIVGGRAAVAQPGDVMTATATAQRVKAAPGDRFAVAIILNFGEGWHAWPNKPVVPKGMEDLVAIPTEVKIAKDMPAPVGVDVLLDRTQWPEPHEIESAAFTGDPVKIQAYSGRAVIYVPVTVGAEAKPGPVVLAFDVSYQACNDTMCMPPTAAHASAKLEVIGAGGATEAGADEALFKDFKTSVFAEPPKVAKPQPAPGLLPAPAKKPGEVLSASAIAQHTTTAPGDQFAVAVVMTLDDGWHVWPNKPVVPKGLEKDLTPRPTTVKVAAGFVAPKGIGIHVDQAQWPEPREVESAGFTGSPVRVLSLVGRFAAYVPITVAADAAPGEVEIPLEVSYQACNDSTCNQPTTALTSVKFRIGKTVEAAADEKEFAGFKASVFAEILSGAPQTASNAPTGGVAAAPGPLPSLFGYELPDPRGPVGIAVLLIVSILGGAVMNLTPCVLPVIPIKVMTLTQHAGSPHRALRLGLWMALGIVAFWTAIGVPMAFISSALDPSRYIFGIWWVTLSIGVIIVAMGLGIMGMFNITLPQSVYMMNPKADTPWGSFVFGIMTAILGLPCFGFVAGGLLAAASTMPAISTMSVFFGIGAGMAVPFLVLAAKPELLKKMPRTGPASELVKQVMGLMLLAGAGYFIAVGLQTLAANKPYVADALQWWTPALFLSLGGLWLAARTFQITSSAGRRLVFGVIGLLLIVASVSLALSQTREKRENYLKLKAAETMGDAFVTGAWNDYTPAKFDKARAAGKIVVADFTANWCLICETLKQAVLDVDPVNAQIMKDDVVVFKVDLSSEGAPGWKFLNSIGRVGIPTLAIFTPGVEQPEIFNAYTSSTVMEALKRAREKAK